MDHLQRSTIHDTMLSKRSFESDTWLILGLTVLIFVILSSIGVFVVCYRRRGHKRRMDRKRMMAAKTRGDYVQLDGEKGDADADEVSLKDRSVVTPHNDVQLPRFSPPSPPMDSGSQPNPNAPTLPVDPDIRRDSSPQPQIEPQVGIAEVNVQYPQPHGVYLPPPVVSNGRGRRLSLGVEYDGHDDDYDGRTSQRFDRSRSPSPKPGRLVLSRSASMLEPR